MFLNASITKDSVELINYFINHFKLSDASFCPRQFSVLIPSLWIVRPQVPSMLPYKLNIWATVKDSATFCSIFFTEIFAMTFFYFCRRSKSFNSTDFFLLTVSTENRILYLKPVCTLCSMYTCSFLVFSFKTRTRFSLFL